jgi:hypothetical protein
LEPERAGPFEYLPELRRRIALLRRIQADADDPAAVRQRLFEGPHCLRSLAIAQKTHDQPGAEAQPVASVLERPRDAVQYRFESDAAARVSLRVEEDLGMEDILVVGLVQIGPVIS